MMSTDFLHLLFLLLFVALSSPVFLLSSSAKTILQTNAQTEASASQLLEHYPQLQGFVSQIAEVAVGALHGEIADAGNKAHTTATQVKNGLDSLLTSARSSSFSSLSSASSSLPSYSTSGHPFITFASGAADGSLSQWLYDLVIHIPDIILQESFLGISYTISVTDFICKDIVIGNLNSSFIPPTTFSSDISGVGISCTADLSVSSIIGTITGNMDVGITNLGLATTLLLTQDDMKLANSSALTQCAMTLAPNDVTIHITGGFVDAFINFIIQVLKGTLVTEIDGLVCPMLTPIIATNLTNVLQKINNYVRPYMAPPSPSQLDPVFPDAWKSRTNELTNLTTARFIQVIHNFANNLIGASGQPIDINRLIDTLFKNGTIDMGPKLLQAIGVLIAPLLNSSSPIKILPRPYEGGLAIWINIAALNANLTLGITRFYLTGLDTWYDMDLFGPVAPYLLRVQTGLQTLNTSIDFYVNVSLPMSSSSSIISDTDPSQLSEAGTFQFALSENIFDAYAELLFNNDILSAISMAQIGQGGAVCALSSLVFGQIPAIYFSTIIKQIAILPQAGVTGLELQLDNMIDQFVMLFVTSFEPAIPALFNGFIDGPLRTLLNSTLQNAINSSLAEVAAVQAMHPELANDSSTAYGACPLRPNINPIIPEPIVNQTSKLANFKTSSLIGALDYLLNVVVGSDGPLGINFLVNLLLGSGTVVITPKTLTDLMQTVGSLIGSTASTASTLLNLTTNGVTITVGTDPIDGLDLSVAIPSLDNTAIALTISYLEIDGLDTFYDVDLFDPVNEYTLLVQTGLKTLNITMDFSIKLLLPILSDSTLLSELSPALAQYSQSSDSARLHLLLTNNVLDAYAEVLLDNELLSDLTLQQMLGGGSTCLMTPLMYGQMPAFSLGTHIDVMTITPKSGASPLIVKLDDIINLFVAAFAPALPGIINGIIDGPIKSAVDGLFVNIVNETSIAAAAARALNPDQINNPYTSYGACPAADNDQLGFSASPTKLGFGSIMGFAVVLCCGLFYFGAKNHHRRQASKGKPYTAPEPSSKHTIASGPTRKHLTVTQKRENAPPLALQPHVNDVYRYGIPLLLCVNMAMFVSSNNGVGAGVSARLSWPDGAEWLFNLFNFGLADTVRDMWTAQVYPLSIIIAVFSGAWPYLKLVLMLLCWLIPPRALSGKLRERFLMMLDALGKWSLIDAYIMTLFMVAFRFHIVPPPPSDIKSTNASQASNSTNYTYVPSAIDVFVIPEYGIFSFVGGTILSLILTHIILHIHRSAPTSQSLALKQLEENERMKAHQQQQQVGAVNAMSASPPAAPVAKPAKARAPNQSAPPMTPQGSCAANPYICVNADGLTSPAHGNTTSAENTTPPLPVSDSGDGISPSSSNDSNKMSNSNSPNSSVKSAGALRNEALEKRPLMHHMRKAKGKYIGPSALGKFTVFAMLFLVLILFCVGSYVDTFEFHFAGVAGAIMGDAAFQSYSLLSLFTSLPSSSNTPNDFGVRFIQFTYLLFALIMPLAHVLVLLVLWVTPLTLKQQFRLFVAAEVLNAWSAVEVFVVSVIASILEIQQFAAFIVGDKCGPLQPILDRPNLVALIGSDKCFDVIASLQQGCWILFAAIIFYMIARAAIMYICHESLHDRRAAAAKAVLLQYKHEGVYVADNENDTDSDSDEDVDNAAERDGWKAKCVAGYEFAIAPFIKIVPRHKKRRNPNVAASADSDSPSHGSPLDRPESPPHERNDDQLFTAPVLFPQNVISTAAPSPAVSADSAVPTSTNADNADDDLHRYSRIPQSPPGRPLIHNHNHTHTNTTYASSSVMHADYERKNDAASQAAMKQYAGRASSTRAKQGSHSGNTAGYENFTTV